MGAVSEIPAPDALMLQAAALAGDEPRSSYLEVRCLCADGRPGPRQFLPVRERRQMVEIARPKKSPTVPQASNSALIELVGGEGA
jgi:hypothetical protein